MVVVISILMGVLALSALMFFGGLVLAISNAASQKRRRIPDNTPAKVFLDGHGELAAEPGVLLNTLWEHLPNVDCQQGECGGCKVRLLSGQVRWIRDVNFPIDREKEFLACSCEALPGTSLRCSVGS